MAKILIVLFLTIVGTFAIENQEKKQVKRSYGFPPYDTFPGALGALTAPTPWFGVAKPLPPSPAEITAAIQTAKQANANVLIAQQQVQAEKENVLQQQKIANEKEHYATIAKQKNDVFSAVQRSEAAAAAQAVVLAQQRLAAAKQAVAHQQRLAAHKEANAAAAIQNAAHAAAAEIHRTEHLASKLSNVQRHDNAFLNHHTATIKDTVVSPLTTGGNNIPPYIPPFGASFSHGPWTPMPSAPWNYNTGVAASPFYPSQKSIFAPWQ